MMTDERLEEIGSKRVLMGIMPRLMTKELIDEIRRLRSELAICESDRAANISIIIRDGKERDALRAELRDIYAQVEAVDRSKLVAEVGELKRRLAVFTEGIPSRHDFEHADITVGGGGNAERIHFWLQRIIAALDEVQL